jgi:hypothetical protein
VNRASCDITIGTAIGAGMDVDYDQPTYPDTPALAFAASGSARTSAATTASTSPATSSTIRPPPCALQHGQWRPAAVAGPRLA